VVVWAHNSHLGDARATEMGHRGELNVGQLVRERFGDEALLVGFTTSIGTVTAADDWDAPARRKRIRIPLPDSYEDLFHRLDAANFLLPLRDSAGIAADLADPRLERAIGVIYRPQSERMSHYFHAQLPEQFDAVLHFDETEALEPIDPEPGWSAPDAPETYPFNV
jgi:erythromycin esterase-like protein